MNSHCPILVVDDEATCESLATWLSRDGYEVDTASSGEEALEKSRQREYCIYFVDLEMAEGMDGLEASARIRGQHPEAAVVMVAAQPTVERAIAALNQGASEYIVKPCSPEEISHLVNRIVQMKSLEHENSLLRKKLNGQYMVGDIITRNPRMGDLLARCSELAKLDTPILVRGDRGTGKKMVARAIHYSGHRASRPMLRVSCTGLAAAELFGCEKGASNGAGRQKHGQLEIADGGTLLLAEVGDLSPQLQLDMLRFLRQGFFYRVGGVQEVRPDVRVLADTRGDLPAAVSDGKFDGELYNCLNAVAIDIPPLRERREDIPLLTSHFLERSAKDKREISEGAWKLLMEYNWPGNVGELENAIECALAISKSPVLGEDAFAFLVLQELAARTQPVPPMTLAAMEKVLIVETLRRTIGNIKESAVQLGIDRSTLYEKIKRYDIPR